MNLRRLARCRIRDRHDWRVIAVSTALPSLGLPSQYRAICRTCHLSGGPVLLGSAALPVLSSPESARAVERGPLATADAGATRAGRHVGAAPA